MMEFGCTRARLQRGPDWNRPDEMQVATIAACVSAVSFVGTPSFLKLIVDKSDELKADFSCLSALGRRRVPAAGAAQGAGERGIRVTQSYATADLACLPTSRRCRWLGHEA